jgi:replicative DNA helicase
MKRKSFEDIGGMIPPQDIELEEAILGALMLEKDAYDRICEIITPDTFYKEANKEIFKVIVSLITEKKNVDILTVTSELRKNGKIDSIGVLYITELTSRVASAANIESHAMFVAEKYLSREIIRISSEFTQRAFKDEDDIFEMIDELYSQVDVLKSFGSGNDAGQSFRDMLKERVELKEKMVNEGVKFMGIPTGNEYLDKVLGGFVDSNVILVAARPAMGKSVKALEYAKACAELAKKPAAIFSLEMSSDELVDRFLVNQSMINLTNYRTNQLLPYELIALQSAKTALSKLPIHIYDSPNVNTNSIKRKYNQLKKKGVELGLIVIDYIQLMTTNGAKSRSGNREQEVSEISRGLKILAKELNVPIIALAQVGRSAEKNSDKRPTLSDLRESGSLENDADVVMFLYRPSYYFHKQEECPDDYYSPNNMTDRDYQDAAEVIIAKNRNGIPVATINEKFFGQFSKFVDAKKSTDIGEVFGNYDDSETETPF